jgi:multifunctional methyltransferase subunit TRM112
MVLLWGCTHTRIITHLFVLLILYLSRTTNGFPLKIEASLVCIEATPYEEHLVRKVLSRVDLAVLLEAFQQVRESSCTVNNEGKLTLPNLPIINPETLIPSLETGLPIENVMVEDLLKSLHIILFDLHVLEGHLICPGTGRKFPIRNGIPNMILHEDEM